MEIQIRRAQSTINNVKIFYEAQEKGIKWYDDYSSMASVAKDKSVYAEGLKILTAAKIAYCSRTSKSR